MGRPRASIEEHAGDNSEGFNTTVFPAATAPISGSKESPVFLLIESMLVHNSYIDPMKKSLN